MTAAEPRPSAPPLPELRQDLRLGDGPAGNGAATWLIYDPVKHRYFQISHDAFELLERWRPEPADEFLERVREDLGRAVSLDDVNELTRFLIANNLALYPPRDDARELARQEASTRHALIWRIVHNYLFFKVPILRPERFLKATLPIVAPLYTRRAAAVVVALGVVGAYFASRQWDHFVDTFLDFLSLEGALVYGLTLVAVKSLHELGHAFTAARAGVRVNTMGVAFMVLTPILYTDVTDAWRLKSKRAKLAIDAAGIIVELSLACISIFLWSFLPEGPLRSAAFLTATTSLIMGLAVNLNPLMRFDGYHILADAWQVPNLQTRSNNLARWWLRETLFGLGAETPEPFPPRKRASLIAYALAIWTYRFFLFLGIALVVYHMFFKALGLVLFGIEIIWFILLPIYSEIREWWQMRTVIRKSPRTVFISGAALAAVAAMVVPWSGSIAIPAVALADLESRIYAPRQARVVAMSIADGAPVRAGQHLLALNAPDLDHEIAQTERQIELAQLRLDRIAGDAADLSERIVIDSELKRHRTNLAGLLKEKKRLAVDAPHDGVARDVDIDLAPGQWLDESMPVARIVHIDAPQGQGYIAEEDVWRVSEGTTAYFVPEDPLASRLTGQVTEVVQTGIRSVDLQALASVYGGAVPTDRSPDNELRPRSGRHLIRVSLEGPPVSHAMRGTLHISAKRESFAAAVWRRILQVLVRESSA